MITRPYFSLAYGGQGISKTCCAIEVHISKAQPALVFFTRTDRSFLSGCHKGLGI